MGGKRNIRRGINRPFTWGFLILSLHGLNSTGARGGTSICIACINRVFEGYFGTNLSSIRYPQIEKPHSMPGTKKDAGTAIWPQNSRQVRFWATKCTPLIPDAAPGCCKQWASEREFALFCQKPKEGISRKFLPKHRKGLFLPERGYFCQKGAFSAEIGYYGNNSKISIVNVVSDLL